MLPSIFLNLLGLKWYGCVHQQLGKHGASLYKVMGDTSVDRVDG